MLNYMNKLIHGNCIEQMPKMKAESVPFGLTSPPYGKIRDFDGHVDDFDFVAIAKELWRIIVVGGVFCWHVQEQCKNWNESGTASRQRLYFQELGFNLYGKIIVETPSHHRTSRYRYGAPVQEVFLLSKGKPRAIHLIKDVPNKHAGVTKVWSIREQDGSIQRQKVVVHKDYRVRGSVWRYNAGFNHTTTDRDAFEHPALMPEKLARDLIISFSNPGDLVFDPMAGAATTLKMAMLTRRHYLGFEICEKYVELGQRRLRRYRHSPPVKLPPVA